MMKSKPDNFIFWKNGKLPSILQSEVAECGLVCLTMIANYWGNMIDVPAMRRNFSISLKGMTLKGLISTAASLSFQARPLKLEVDHVSELKLPCILHWNMNHFVVLKKVNRNYFIIHDPSVGAKKISNSEFRKNFTGIALEVIPAHNFSKLAAARKASIFSLWGRITGVKRNMLQILFLGIFIQICALAAPFYMQWIVDDALLSADRDLIITLAVGFALVAFVQCAASAIRSWCATLLSLDINFQWFGNMFSHLLRLPMQFFESRHSGDIISRFSSISTIQHGLTTNLAEGLMDGILAIVTLVAMFAYDVSLTFGSIAVCLLYLIFRICFYSPLKSASAEQIIHSSKQGTHFLESVRGIQSIKIFNKPMERKVAWMNFLANQFSAEARISKISITQQAANGVLFSTEKIVIILFGAMAVLKSEITIGMLFAFISYKDQFTQRISSLIDKFFELKMLNLHAERLSDIVDAIAEDDSYDSKISTIDGDISITLKDVSFRYSRYENFVLKNVNLHIPAGQCIAITGASGSGKSTLLKLLLGLIVPTEGEILINNVSLSKIGIPSYRNLLGAVMQDDCLFSGTIADNISFFDSPLDFERIGIAAQLASVHSDISAMPMGYNTLIGDIGSGLSGGQKQRVLLARALYKIPLLVVLDEATSHLDVENEAMVNQAVTALSLTRIIVAHRPSTIAMAERVVELAHGSIRFDKLNPGRKNIIATKPGSFAGSFKTRDISKPSIRSVLHR